MLSSGYPWALTDGAELNSNLVMSITQSELRLSTLRVGDDKSRLDSCMIYHAVSMIDRILKSLEAYRIRASLLGPSRPVQS